MATRERTISAAEALYVGPSPATGQHFNSGTSGINWVSQLYRVQSINYNWSFNRGVVNQFGELAAIDQPHVDTPSVALSFSYLLANMQNEKNLGFHISGDATCISGILNKTKDEKNFFIKTVPEGEDAVDSITNGSNNYLVGIGNGFITSYSAEASVGSFPSASVSVEALNVLITTGVSGREIPAINPTNGAKITQWVYSLPTAQSSPGAGDLDISVLRPGDVLFSFLQREAPDDGSLGPATDPYATMGADIGATDAKIQSFSLGVDLSREAISKLGSRYATSREITFPVNATLSIDALVQDLTTGNLADILTCDKAYDIKVKLLKPDDCAGDSTTIIAQYELKNARLTSQSYSASIGSNKNVTLDFVTQLGGPNQTTVGLFMSGLAVEPY